MASVLLITILSGCATPIPVYPAMSDSEAVQAIRRRQATLTRVSADCTLLLADEHGARVSLDGVLIAKLPHRLRIRTWKLGQAVFDLTLREDGAWLFESRRDRTANRFDSRTLSVKRIGESLDLLGSAYFQTAVPVGGDESSLVVRGHAFGLRDIDCEIDRATLTPTRFILPTGPDTPDRQLLLSRYIAADEHVWPGRMQLLDSAGAITIRFGVVEVNGEIPPSAFTPPRRAQLLP
jgi:hypothetical protein